MDVKSKSKEKDTKHPEHYQDDREMDFTCELTITPGAAAGSFTVQAKNYQSKLAPSVKSDEPKDATFGECLPQTQRLFTQDPTSGALQFAECTKEMCNPKEWGKDHGCAWHLGSIQVYIMLVVLYIGHEVYI